MRLFLSSNNNNMSATSQPHHHVFLLDRLVVLLWRKPQWVVAAVALSTLLIFYSLHVDPEQSAATDIYAATPMCDPVSGVCGEDAHHPSPRTVFSARSLEQYERWWSAHAALNRSAAEYDVMAADQSGDVGATPLLLLGDSITESWRGTNMGEPEARAKGVPQVLQSRFLPQYRPLVLAIGGDQTQHLLYRLQNGELLDPVRQSRDAIFVVLIGTNNLGSGLLPEATVEGIQAVAEYLLEETQGRVILQLLLPRGDSFRLPALCPPRCASASDSENNNKNKPYASFMPAVAKVNQAVLLQVKPELQKLHPGRLSVVDCSEPFVADAKYIRGGDDEVKKNLMPDLLHPNAAGHELLATCLLDCIQGRTCSA